MSCALNELVVGFHGGFKAPCFFNTPPVKTVRLEGQSDKKMHTFKNI